MTTHDIFDDLVGTIERMGWTVNDRIVRTDADTFHVEASKGAQSIVAKGDTRRGAVFHLLQAVKEAEKRS